MNKMSRKISALLCVVFITSLMQLPASAAPSKEYSNDFNGTNFNSYGDIFALSDSKEYCTITQTGGLGGRSSTDQSLAFNVNGLPADKTSATINFRTLAGSINKQQTSKVRCASVQFSVLYDGNADGMTLALKSNIGAFNLVKVENQKVLTLKYNATRDGHDEYDTGIICNKGEWLRISLNYDYYPTNAHLYINGKDSGMVLKNTATTTINWMQIYANFNADNPDKTGRVVIDDYSSYFETASQNYALGTAAQTSYSFSNSALDFNQSEKRIYLGSNQITGSALAACFTTMNTLRVQKSINNTEEVTSDYVTDGNVVVILSEDTKTYDYVHIKEGEYNQIVNYNQLPSGQITQDKEYDSIRSATGLFGKPDTDTSMTLVTMALPSEISTASRYTFMGTSDWSPMFDANSFTVEYSVGGSGDVDRIGYLNYFKYSDGSTTTKQFSSPVKFTPDGILVWDTNQYNTTTGEHYRKYVKPFYKDQWYRVAVVYRCKDLTMDIYIDGEKVVDNGYVSENDNLHDAAVYDITGYEWKIQLQPSYSAKITGSDTRSGFVAVDDTLCYYGSYQDKTENNVTAQFDNSVNVDEVFGKIYINDIMDIGDFVDLTITENDYKIYTDHTFSAEAEEISEDCVLVLTSDNEYNFKYYTFASTDITTDNPIKYYVNGTQDTNHITNNGDTIKAAVSAYAPEYAGKQGVLMLAIYKDGALVDVVQDSRNILGDTEFSVEKEIADMVGFSARAMFWDTINIMKPYIGSCDFTAAILD